MTDFDTTTALGAVLHWLTSQSPAVAGEQAAEQARMLGYLVGTAGLVVGCAVLGVIALGGRTAALLAADGYLAANGLPRLGTAALVVVPAFLTGIVAVPLGSACLAPAFDGVARGLGVLWPAGGRVADPEKDSRG